jgi:hypothetical protein
MIWQGFQVVFSQPAGVLLFDTMRAHVAWHLKTVKVLSTKTAQGCGTAGMMS